MKIIDEKGKVFGKINIVDLSVILFLIMFVPMLYFVGKALLSDYGTQDTRWVEVRVKFTNLEPELSAIIKKGDIAKNNAGNTCGEVLNVVKIEPSEYAVTPKGEAAVILPHPYKKDVTADMNFFCKIKSGVLFYNDTALKIGGGQIEFSPYTYTASGRILKIKTE